MRRGGYFVWALRLRGSGSSGGGGEQRLLCDPVEEAAHVVHLVERLWRGGGRPRLSAHATPGGAGKAGRRRTGEGGGERTESAAAPVRARRGRRPR